MLEVFTKIYSFGLQNYRIFKRTDYSGATAKHRPSFAPTAEWAHNGGDFSQKGA
ncbi:hypothetical protein D082_16600 [Synechocystis sp. PCC 6714]|nr:hypothetical protein D082_16600 [Synechocystis sp. PCC 6714]